MPISGWPDYRQPLRGGMIDVTHPWAPGLMGYYAMTEGGGTALTDWGPYALHLTTLGYSGINPFIFGAYGSALGLVVTGRGAQAVVPSGMRVGWPITFAVGFRSATNSVSNSVVIETSYTSSNVSPYIVWNLQRNSATALQVQWNSAGTQNNLTVTSPTWGVKTDHVIVCQVGPTSQRVFADGVELGSSSYTLSDPNWTSGSTFFLGSYSGYTGSNAGGSVYWAAWWHRLFRSSELAAMSSQVPSVWPMVSPWPMRSIFFGCPLSVWNGAASGGAVLSGSASSSSSSTPPAAGGGVLGGAAAASAILTASAAGGAVLGGVPSWTLIYIAAASGGGILGGAAAESSSYAPPASGGGILGGVADESSSYAPPASGGGILGGIADESSSYAPPASGGGILGGVADESSSYAPDISGGAVLSGAAQGVYILTASAAGGAVLSGSAAESSSSTPGAAGGAVLSGSAASSWAYSPSASGGAVLGGVAAGSSSYAPDASGGAVLGGTSPGASFVVAAASGGAVLSGVAYGSSLLIGVASGGVVISGVATAAAGPGGNLTFRQTLHAKLSSVPEITQVVGSAIYFGALPQTHDLGRDGPALTYSISSYPRGHVLSGPDGTASAHVQISAWSYLESQADAIVLAVWNAIDGTPRNPWATNAVTIMSVSQQDETDLPEAPKAGSDQWVYQIATEWLIRHRTAIPTLS